ncbi:integral membrane protein [Thozetella sp. PMI_491]|nr:integral membrane protein [Thozetella sp. PMI_491]
MDAAPGNVPGASRALEIQIPCTAFFILTPVFVGLRVWSRIRSRSGLGRDDWTIIASLLCCLTVSALMMGSCYYGFGQRIANLSASNRLMTLKLFYVAQAFYKITINLTKASILLLYLRIFLQRWFRIACYVLLAIILAYMVSTLSSSIWQCSPVPRAWDKSIAGTCIDITTNWYANAGFSIASDIFILLLPMQPLYTSKLPARHKVALMAVFTLGVFVTVTSILRMQTLSFSSKSLDTTYDISSSVWTIVEDNLAIICACLPMCRWPFLSFVPFSSWRFKSDSYDNSNQFSATETIGGTTIRQRDRWSHLPERQEKDDMHMADMELRETSRHSSQDMILEPTASTRPRDSGQFSKRESDIRSIIHKTTEYEVTFTTSYPMEV